MKSRFEKNVMSASIRSERKQEVKTIEQFMLFLHILPSLVLAMFVSGIYFLLVLKCTELAKIIQTYTMKRFKEFFNLLPYLVWTFLDVS